MGIRAWIGVALLAGSWLLGLSYYQPANSLAWAAVLTAGVALVCARRATVVADVPPGQDLAAMDPTATALGTAQTAEASLGARETLAAVLLLLPVVWFTVWPWRAAPLVLAVGLGLGLLPPARAVLRSIGTGMSAAGMVLFVQALALSEYANQTACNHDMPWPAPEVLATLAQLLGMDAAADGPTVVLQTVRQPHRLAVTWDSVFDPATVCFLLGGLTMLGLAAWSRLPAGRRFLPWLAAARGLATVVLAWLPVRAGLMMALYVHRVVRSDYNLPLHVMNQFLSPWVHLLLLAVPVLLAWRFARLKVLGSESRVQDVTEAKTREGSVAKGQAPTPQAPRPKTQDARPIPSYLAAALVLLAAMLAAVATQWQPSGERKQDRVVWVERHSTWSPTAPNGRGAGGTYDTENFGGSDEDSSGYNYAAIYRYLGQFYEMDRIEQQGSIDDDSLARCAVLVIKVPKDRYSDEEIEAVKRFVHRGGGLLMIGDHTNYERSSARMNDITRHFGFTWRDDLLYSEEPEPDQQHYTASRVPHPAVQHVKEFDFAVSCSIDPGSSRGRPVIRGGRLWSLPADYHIDNFMPYAQHRPEMRYGPFAQVWAADYGNGRVIAWTDSTIFSNFCVHQPGKAELMLNMVEWLNHQALPLDPYWPLLLLAALPLAAALWRGAAFRGASIPLAWPLLLAAAAFGWVIGSEATAALHRRALPLPEAARPMPRIVIDRTTSQVPLATGAYNDDKEGRGYGLLEQWIPRLKYYTVRADGPDALAGDALVVICPSRQPSEEFCERLVQYVAEGGKLLVLDSPQEGRTSTANNLLRPFGLVFNDEQPWQGDLQFSGKWPPIRVEQAWEVTGGQRVASLGGQRTVCATVGYGQGTVMAVGFGDLLNDAHMGGQWAQKPDDQQRVRYHVLFALMQLLVEGQPVVAPSSPAAKPEIPEPKKVEIPEPKAELLTPR